MDTFWRYGTTMGARCTTPQWLLNGATRRQQNDYQVENMTIIIDSREQTPWSFPEGIDTERGTLNAGDYALLEDGGFAIERKSLPDFVSTIVTDRARFERELNRMAAFPAKIIIVEAALYDVFEHQYPNPKISPAYVLSQVAEFALRGVQVIWAGDPLGAAAIALSILRKRDSQLQEEIPF